ncbi:MAG: DUF2100 domain-containing protein [Candidatus Lokiarchaeota archaeon]|nr:DUF2100 domain-containing protein [Candidatus Lokiarchaeota archaeon]
MIIKKEYIKNILDTFDDLIDIKIIIRESSPDYKLNDLLQNKFIYSLNSIKNKLNPIFSTYLSNFNSKKYINNQRNSLDQIRNIFKKGNMAIISSNSAKKILKNFGIDPRQLIVTGGPFFMEDYEKINPGIEKKCNRLLEEIKNIEWYDKELYFLCENQNKSDKLTLRKLDKISELIKKPVKIIEIESWNEFKEDLT